MMNISSKETSCVQSWKNGIKTRIEVSYFGNFNFLWFQHKNNIIKFVYDIFKYDVDAQVLNETTANNYDNKLRGNSQ